MHFSTLQQINCTLKNYIDIQYIGKVLWWENELLSLVLLMMLLCVHACMWCSLSCGSYVTTEWLNLLLDHWRYCFNSFLFFLLIKKTLKTLFWDISFKVSVQSSPFIWKLKVVGMHVLVVMNSHNAALCYISVYIFHIVYGLVHIGLKMRNSQKELCSDRTVLLFL